MSIHDYIKHTFTLNHTDDVTTAEMKARGCQFEEVLEGIQPKCINKFVPKELAKVYSIAHKELLKVFNNPSADIQEDIAKTVVKFNVITTEEGQSKLFPIGLLALSHLKCINGGLAIGIQQKVANHALSHTLAQLHQEYLKHKIQNPPIKERVETFRDFNDTPRIYRTKTDEGAPANPVEADTPLEIIFKDNPPVIVETEGEPIPGDPLRTTPVSEKKATEEKKGKKPAKIANSKKNKVMTKSKKKEGFFKSVSNFFKNMFASISRFFSGKKEKSKKIQK